MPTNSTHSLFRGRYRETWHVKRVRETEDHRGQFSVGDVRYSKEYHDKGAAEREAASWNADDSGWRATVETGKAPANTHGRPKG